MTRIRYWSSVRPQEERELGENQCLGVGRNHANFGNRDKKHMAGLVTKNTTTIKLTSLGEVELTAAKIS
jgi:hypothetical protein